MHRAPVLRCIRVPLNFDSISSRLAPRRCIYAGSRISAQLLCRKVTPICVCFLVSFSSSSSSPSPLSCPSFLSFLPSSPNPHPHPPPPHRRRPILPPPEPLETPGKGKCTHSKHAHGADNTPVLGAQQRRHGAAREPGLGAAGLGRELAGGHFFLCAVSRGVGSCGVA
jgi:hypothetical protein